MAIDKTLLLNLILNNAPMVAMALMQNRRFPAQNEINDAISTAVNRGYDLGLLEDSVKPYGYPLGYMGDPEVGDGFSILRDDIKQPFESDVYGRYSPAPAATSARVFSHPTMSKTLQNTPNLAEAYFRNQQHKVNTSPNKGLDALLALGYDENLLEDTLVNTGSITHVSDMVENSHFPRYKPDRFPSDELQVLGWDDISDPMEVASNINRLNPSGLNKLYSENKNRPALASAFAMLSKNPKIGIK